MAKSKKQNSWRRHAILRQRVVAGDLQAHYELGHELLEGIRDLRGQFVVRQNSPYAVRLLRAAVDGKHPAASGLLRD